jgi:DNA-directed RNA polymerase specialized sigma54-like protein
MSDEPNGQEEVVETQVEEKPQEEVTASDKPTEEGLPEDVSERTRTEFEKLKAHNKELSEKLKSLEPKPQSVFDSLRPQTPQAFGNLTPQQVGDISQKYTDGEGYLDENALSQALRDANERARRAEVAAQQTRDEFRQFEEKEQVRKTHSKFPQLDSNSDQFDPRFWETRSKTTRSEG